LILMLLGLLGFGYVAVVLTDSRFDLLLAAIGAYRTDELYERLVTEQVYADEPVRDSQRGRSGSVPGTAGTSPQNAGVRDARTRRRPRAAP
jgi:hypothetical protein